MGDVSEGNKLKLGVFGANLDGGCSASLVAPYRLSWERSKDLMTIVDQGGFEAMVPVARWKGLSPDTQYTGVNFETLSWSAGMAAVTDSIHLYSTVHVPTIHPIVAARQLTTIDHISGGRAGLNVVCGWYAPEFEMYGSPFMSHGDRYAYAAEWIDCVRLLWTREEEFDFEGKFFRIKAGWQQPKPLQRPQPRIMQAGNSEDGRAFQAKYADLAFVGTKKPDRVHQADHDEIRQIFHYPRSLARSEFGRELEVWICGIVICRDTVREAREYFDYCFGEMGDKAMLSNFPSYLMADMTPEQRALTEQRFLAGFSSHMLVGTAEQIVGELELLSDLGLDGIALHWLDYNTESRQFLDEVMPLMEQAGLRKPRG